MTDRPGPPWSPHDFPYMNKRYFRSISLRFFLKFLSHGSEDEQKEPSPKTARQRKLEPLSLPGNNFMAETHQLAGEYENFCRQYQDTTANGPRCPLAREYSLGFCSKAGSSEAAMTKHQKSYAPRWPKLPRWPAPKLPPAWKACQAGGPTGYGGESQSRCLVR
jgi:hypothetical protein